MTGERVLPNLGLKNMWTPGSNGWSTGMDADLAMLDALLHLAVKSATISAPPASPAAGDRYIVPVGATGAWNGQDKAVAVYVDAGWTFYAPRSGWSAKVLDVPGRVEFDGTAWGAAGTGSSAGSSTGSSTGSTGSTTTGSSTGGASSGTALSTVAQVQVATASTFQNNGSNYTATVSLPQAPIPGNLLLFLTTGWSGVWAPPPGVTPIGGILLGGTSNGYFANVATAPWLSNSGSDQQISAYARPVVSGDGKDWPFAILTGDVFNCVLLELSGVGSVEFQGATVGRGAANFTAQAPLVMPRVPGEQVWIILETDSVPTSVSPSPGYTTQYSLAGGSRGGHQGVYASRDAKINPGSIEAPSFAVVGGNPNTSNIAATVRILPHVQAGTA